MFIKNGGQHRGIGRLHRQAVKKMEREAHMFENAGCWGSEIALPQVVGAAAAKATIGRWSLGSPKEVSRATDTPHGDPMAATRHPIPQRRQKRFQGVGIRRPSARAPSGAGPAPVGRGHRAVAQPGMAQNLMDIGWIAHRARGIGQRLRQNANNQRGERCT